MNKDLSSELTEKVWNTESSYKHPGKHLEELLEELEISKMELSRNTGIPASRISEISKGVRSISPDQSIRLGKYFRQDEKFWLNLQAEYDLRKARESDDAEIEPRTARSQYWVYQGGLIPGLVRPLAIVTTTEVQSNLCISEAYLFIPKSKMNEKIAIKEVKKWKNDALNGVFDLFGYVSDATLQECRCYIEMHYFNDYKIADHFLRGRGYEFEEVKNHQLGYLTDWQFHGDVKMIIDKTACESLRDFLRMVLKVNVQSVRY